MNLAEIIANHPDDVPALISRGRTTTYGELRSQVGHLRGGLAGAGVGEGDRVAILAANNWYFVVTYLATLGLGAVAVPLNPSSPGPEVTKELAAVAASAILVGPTGRRVLPDIDRDAVPALDLVVCADGSQHPDDDVVHLDDLLESEPVPIVDRDGDDLAVLMFTSGTAGSPKAAMLSHGNLLANIDQIMANPHRTQDASDVVLGVLPFFHIYGLNVILGYTFHTGGTVLTIERFDPESAIESIVNHGVTSISGAPTMWAAWALLSDIPADAFSEVRVTASGAARLDPDVRARMQERFGITVSEGYGLTEASPAVTNSVGLPAPVGSIGAPLPGVKVRLIDTDGHDVLVGDVGELRVQGPNVFKGYWEDAEATANALTPDGWLKTGDMALVDDQGFLFLVDRKKDLIIVSGFNVYPAEVEGVLAEHPGVAQAAVVGVKHPYSGEAVKAFVVTEPGSSVEEDDIIYFCEQRLARYKCPQKVTFVDELPASANGKIRRHELR